MGVIAKHRPKYISHKKRWDKQTILDEAVLTKDYAIRNKKEIRKAEYLLTKFKGIAKELNVSEELQNSAQAKNFIANLKAMGYLKPTAATLDEVLDIKLRDILERRLSNILYRHKLAKTPAQARQFIVHRHVEVSGTVVTSPGHLVSLEEEATLTFNNRSALSDEAHPERAGPQEETLAKVAGQAPANSGAVSVEAEAAVEDEEADEVKAD
jgi:small subunit ribosomal protein S4